MTEFMVVHNMIKDYIHINNQVSDRHIFYDQNTYKEISISLFGECNMNCEFCIGNQRHKVHCPHDFETTIAAAKKEIENTKKTYRLFFMVVNYFMMELKIRRLFNTNVLLIN